MNGILNYSGWLIGIVFAFAGGRVLVRNIVKKYIDHALDKKLESHRISLQLKSLEFEIRYRRVWDKQEEVLAKTYELLFYVYKQCKLYASCIANDRPASREAAHQCNEEFKVFFHPRRIYFPKETGDRINKFVIQCVDLVKLYDKFEKPIPNAEAYDKLDTDYVTLEKDNQKLFHELQAELQEILGIERRELRK